MRISKSTKTSVTASSNISPEKVEFYKEFLSKYLSEDELKYMSPEQLKDKYFVYRIQTRSGDLEDMKKEWGNLNSSTSTDKALQHIKAAIDILGKSGDKSDVTKDSIANLAIVAMDLKGSSKE